MDKKLFTSQDMVGFLGISRHKLIYWTDRAKLVEPYQRLQKTNIYDQKNVLDFALIKALSNFGISTPKIAAIFNQIKKDKNLNLWDIYKKNQEKNTDLRQLFMVVMAGDMVFCGLVANQSLKENAHYIAFDSPKDKKAKGVQITGMIYIAAYEIVEKVEKFAGDKI